MIDVRSSLGDLCGVIRPHGNAEMYDDNGRIVKVPARFIARHVSGRETDFLTKSAATFWLLACSGITK